MSSPLNIRGVPDHCRPVMLALGINHGAVTSPAPEPHPCRPLLSPGEGGRARGPSDTTPTAGRSLPHGKGACSDTGAHAAFSPTVTGAGLAMTGLIWSSFCLIVSRLKTLMNHTVRSPDQFRMPAAPSSAELPTISGSASTVTEGASGRLRK